MYDPVDDVEVALVVVPVEVGVAVGVPLDPLPEVLVLDEEPVLEAEEVTLVLPLEVGSELVAVLLASLVLRLLESLAVPVVGAAEEVVDAAPVSVTVHVSVVTVPHVVGSLIITPQSNLSVA